jgi:ASC-1-like (ASCH) protein
MHEIGIESALLQDVLTGKKTIEGRIGMPKYLQFRIGDTLRLREDTWQDGQLIRSIPDRARATITQLLYFESFEEMLQAVDFQAAIPNAETKAAALAVYRKYYSEADEAEYGVIAITLRVDEPVAIATS